MVKVIQVVALVDAKDGKLVEVNDAVTFVGLGESGEGRLLPQGLL